MRQKCPLLSNVMIGNIEDALGRHKVEGRGKNREREIKRYVRVCGRFSNFSGRKRGYEMVIEEIGEIL